MPRRNVSRHIGISPHAELLIMIFLGMVRSVMNWLSLTWDRNVQEVWNLPGPSPSFSAQYQYDYWLKTILSFVVLFRNFATPVHLLFYVIMLYPVLTGEQHRLMLPWLHLQMLKNIVADAICTVIGVLLCWLLHSCGLLTLEFLVVRIISMMPSIYLWRRLRSYYFDLYYAELDGECSFSAFKPDISLTLAQRRRAAKSLDGAMLGLTSPDERVRINSCLTYEEIFGVPDWNMDTETKISRSLTTLLTNESQESDEIEEDSRLKIIDDANLTPAEKTMRILGIIKDNSDVATGQFHKITSTTDATESSADISELSMDVKLKFSFSSVTRESNEPGDVSTQIRFPAGSKTVVEQPSEKCACCTESKCSRNDDEDSDKGTIESMSSIVITSQSSPETKKVRDIGVDRTSREKPSNCCNRNRGGESVRRESRDGDRKTNEENEAGANVKETYAKHGTEPSTVSTSSTYHKKDVCRIPRLQAIVERDGIAWDNLKEINFVSVIDKVLRDEFKLFKLRQNYPNGERPGEGSLTNVKNLSEDRHVRAEVFNKVSASIDRDERKAIYEGSQSLREILPEREDGTQFTPVFSAIEQNGFYVPTSANFGVGSDILTSNASYVFDETPVSGIQSFDSTSMPTNSLARSHQDIGFDSHFQSSFEEHSNMFSDSIAEAGSLRCNTHSSVYGTTRTVDDYSPSCQMGQVPAEKGAADNESMTRNSSHDSSQLSRLRMATKEIENTHGSGYYLSTNQTPRFQSGYHDCWDFSEEVLPKNKISCTRSTYSSGKPIDLPFASPRRFDHEKKRLKSNGKAQVPSLVKCGEILPSSSIRSTSVSQTATLMNSSIYNCETSEKKVQTSNHTNFGLRSDFDPERSVKITESTATFSVVNKSVTSETSPPKINKLASSSRSSRSSKDRKTSEKWEDKTLQALKAYNEKTLYKYKREMDARERSNVKNIPSSSVRQVESQFPNRRTGSSFSTQQPEPVCLRQDSMRPVSLSGSMYESNFNQTLYAPSAPELDTPEKELILNIEKAYARFTRSKPVGPVGSEARYQSVAAKEFFDLYSGGKRLRKETQKIKMGEESTARKQHSKYSKLSRETNESDITSKSCKQIEGSQKGRDLDRTLAKENIIAQEIEVYFWERQTDNEPSSSNNLPITMIKSFSQKRGDDTASVVSSETLTPDDFRSPMIEVLENSEDIPCRIDDNEYYRQLRKNNLPGNVREVMKNIDWSFRRPYCAESSHSKQKERNNTVLSVDHRSESQNIVQKTTETMLQSAFANSENSERGFHLGESENGYYPIFDNAAIAMGEIMRAAALRGNRNEFISQPAAEIEAPEINDENLYSSLDLPSKLPRRSSSRRFLTRGILAENAQAVSAGELPPMILNAYQKKFKEPDGREIFAVKEDVSSLLSRPNVSIESESAVLEGFTEPEDTPEGQEDSSGDLPSIRNDDLEVHSKFLFKGSSINREQLKLALQDVIHKFPSAVQGSSLEIPRFFHHEEPQCELDFETCRRILDHFNTGGEEVQSAIVKVLDEFPRCETFVRNDNSSSLLKQILDEGRSRSLGGSDFIAGLEMLSVLNLIITTTGKMINLTENHGGVETSGTEYLSREENDRSGRQFSPEQTMAQPGTSGVPNFDYVNPNASAQSNYLGLDSVNHRENMKFKIDPNGIFPSADKVDEPRNDDEGEFLLSNIPKVDNIVSPTNSELLNRENFRREMIDSVFVEAINEGQGLDRLLRRTELETFEPETDDMIKREEFLVTNNGNVNASYNLMNVKSETHIHRMGDEFLIDGDNVASDLVIGDIETMESLIRKMKTVSKHFVTEDRKRKELLEKEKTRAKTKREVSSLTNLTFLVHGEVQKLDRLVRIVANYATITGCSSELVSLSETAQPPPVVEPSHETNNSDVRRRERTINHRTEESGSFENVPAGPVKKKEESTHDDHQIPRTHKSSRDPPNSIDRFASWDKMIPPSTRLLIAKNRRKSNPKSAVAVREPPRRIVKVVKLVDENESDFFSARSVPQRGKGLSSGYLMDSDSDGNLTVSRPLTPVSVTSETSQTPSCDNEESDVLLNRSVKASEAIATCEPLESSWRSPSRILYKKSSPSSHSAKSIKNLPNFENDSKIAVKKSDDDIKSLKNQRSLENASNLLSVGSEVSSEAKAALPDVINAGNDENIQHDEKLHVLSAEILLTDSALRNISPIDAVRIVNELTNEVQQILIHQFRGVNCLMNGLPIAPKNEIFIPLSDGRGTESDSSTDIQRSASDLEESVDVQHQINEGGEERVKELLRELVEQLIVNCRDADDARSENSDIISLEVLQRKSMISLKHVATGTEYTVAVFKEIMEIFSTNHSIENNVIQVCGTKNSQVARIDNQNDIVVEKGISLVAERSHDVQPLPKYSDENWLKRISNSSSLDSPSNRSWKKNSISGVKLSQLVDSRKEEIIGTEILTKEGIEATSDNPSKANSVNDVLSNKGRSLEVSQENVAERNTVLNPSFASYDSFASLLSQKKNAASERSSRVISLSDHTFLEEFPDEIVDRTSESFSQSREVSDERSSELKQSNSQHDSEEIVSNDRCNESNSRINSAVLINSETNAEDKKRGSASEKRDT